MRILESREIWDLDSIANADGALPEGPPPGGEIHPDLIRYKGYWYCGLKEGPHGVRDYPSRARVIRSADGEKWESVRRVEWAGGHVSDLKFSVTGDGLLMMNTIVSDMAFGAQDEPPARPDRPETGRIRRMSVTWLTEDGVRWGGVHACPTGFSTVRYVVAWHRGMCYSVGYGLKDERGTLYRTADGRTWHTLATNIYDSWHCPEVRVEDMPPDDQRLRHAVQQGNVRRVGVDANDITQAADRGGFAPKPPSEAALEFLPDGTAVAVARAHPVFAILGTAKPPYYEEWTWRAMQVDWNRDGNLRPAGELLGVQMGGPMLRWLSDGRLIAASRADASTETKGIGRLTLYLVDVQNAVLERLASFDGYSHYPGVVEHEGKLWISCGKQQRADLFGAYLLQTELPD